MPTTCDLSLERIHANGALLEQDERRLQAYVAGLTTERLGVFMTHIADGPYDSLTKSVVLTYLGRVVHDRDLLAIGSPAALALADGETT